MPRVVLLARAGKAADNLADALRQAGTELVLAVDPATIDEAALRAARPEAILVALEPGVEAAVDRLDGVLSSPQFTVIFDEADLAAHRAGWDAARWVRHLAAKLHRHGDVLPPGAESEDSLYPSPGQLPKPGAGSALDLSPFTREAVGRAGSVPSDGLQGDAPAVLPEIILPPELSATPAPVAASTPPPPAPQAPDLSALSLTPMDADVPVPALPAVAAPAVASAFAGLSLAPMDIETAPVAAPQEPAAAALLAANPAAEEPAAAQSDVDGGGLKFDDDAFFLEELSSSRNARAAEVDLGLSLADLPDLDVDAAPVEGAGFTRIEMTGIETEGLSLTEFDGGFDADLSGLEVESVEISGFALGDRDLPSAADLPDLPDFSLAAAPEPDAKPQAPAYDTSQFDGLGLDLLDDAPEPPPLPKFSVPPPPPLPSFEGLSLVDDAAPPPPVAAAADRGSAAVNRDLGVLQERISSLSLVDIEEAAPPAAAAAADQAMAIPGLVLVEAGLGGPDPVRQLLAALPATMQLPVLVRLHLQGGRYDRLVTQMERAAALPVVLAEAGQPVRLGKIHFLPEGMGLRMQSGGCYFAQDSDPARSILEAVAPDHLAVLFLSGSESALIDSAVARSAAGALLLAQSPADCYDGAACAQLQARGIPTGLPSELAARVLARWPQ